MHDLLDNFECAWRLDEGRAPKLADFAAGLNGPDRRETLIELIKIDLEYRWRAAAADAPDGRTVARPGLQKLEDYFAEFPDLGDVHEAPAELIEHEYRCRHWWGDRPDPGEYESRFPGNTAVLEADDTRGRRANN